MSVRKAGRPRRAYFPPRPAQVCKAPGCVAGRAFEGGITRACDHCGGTGDAGVFEKLFTGIESPSHGAE